MSEWNIGVDVVEIARFERLNYSSNKHFYMRVFTPKEIEYCLSFSSPAPHFAANFAGKEAVYKAVNRFCDVKIHDIEILRDKYGAPKVNLNLSREEKTSPLNVKVSMSHSLSHAVAFAVAQSSTKIANELNVKAEAVSPNGF
ncbi:MAG: holo-ACP synthase [Candidatus Bathyarchaeum sp.]|nr:MAG: holo-ACP synthase [Candidatus Bathyarchaeum sp.]